MASLPEANPANVSAEAAATDQSLTNILTRPSIITAVFAHLGRTLCIRELVQLKLVCKQFATLVSENNIITTQAHYQDDSVDWYFPLTLSTPDASNKRKRATDAGMQQNRRSSWGWSGIHHPTQETHTLPSLDHLPSVKIRFSDDSFASLLAGSGSLLLFVLKTKYRFLCGASNNAWNDRYYAGSGSLLLFVLKTKYRFLCGASNNAWNDRYYLRPEEPALWIPLLVSNPLTKEYRVLPAPSNAKSTRWDYHGARAHLVEDECADAYKVLLLFRDQLFVYKSSTMCWNSSMFHEPIPWGCRNTEVAPYLSFSDYLDVPCAIVGGKLIYAELDFDGNITYGVQRSDKEMLTKGGVRLFEVDDKAGTWKPADRLALQDFFPEQLHLHDWDLKSNFGIASYAIDIAKCMGGVYILIPASLDISMSVSEEIKQLYNLSGGGAPGVLRYEDCGFLPLRFYVLQLQGNGLLCGQALIQRPQGMSKLQQKKLNRMKLKLDFNPCVSLRWYRCRGYGSVINIVVDKCVIRYNVMTGLSTTEIVVLDPFIGSQPDVAYRPSLQRKP